MRFVYFVVLLVTTYFISGCEKQSETPKAEQMPWESYSAVIPPVEKDPFSDMAVKEYGLHMGEIKFDPSNIDDVKKLAAAGDKYAQGALASRYEMQDGMRDIHKAIEWHQKSADQGNPYSLARLGYIYLSGKDVPRDSPKAVQYLQKANLGYAQFLIGWTYLTGFGITKDIPRGLEWYTKSAESGYADAQYELGLIYSLNYSQNSGLNLDTNGVAVVTKDLTKAVKWWQKAADQGNVLALRQLADIYEVGTDVPKDMVKYLKYSLTAAELGDMSAQYNVGYVYFNGMGVPKDYAKALTWFTKAANQGDKTAQYYVGIIYDGGLGVQKNYLEAAGWLKKSAEQGFVTAQAKLGLLYFDGKGVPKDKRLAADWWKKAASQGSASAQANLGYLYKVGEGVSRNIVLAYAWSNLAAAQGEDFGVNRNLYELQMTPAQREEGQRLASNWKIGDSLDSSNSGATQANSGTPTKQSTGTAFTVSSEGHALTNYHVINGCVEVRIAGREGSAKIVTSDSVNDLALLQLPSKSKDIAFLNPEPSQLRQGEDIIVFGYPLEWALSSGGNLTPGIISALTGLGNNTNQIQITAPIQPGSSGSPVMDKKGNVVGVVSMKLDDAKMAKATGQVGQNVNFAVNGQTVKAFLDAHKVPYKTGGGLFSREKSNADIAEEARKSTVLVECWK